MRRLFALAAALAMTAPASAHVVISPADVVNFSTVRAVITIEHGCDGAPINEVIVGIPEGFLKATPMERKGWQTSVTEGQYRATYHIDGEGDFSRGPVEIRWSGGNAPDGRPLRLMFEGVLQSFNDQTLFAFPVTQVCGETAITWDELPDGIVDPHSLEHPAPYISVTFEAFGENEPGTEVADVVPLGDLEISGAFTRATLPNAPVGGGYLTITNTGTEDERLISAASPVAGVTELHEMKMEGDVMKMMELADGIAVPAGETVTLAPGGLHIMLMDLTGPLVEGTTVPLTLTFETAGVVEISLAVGSKAADAAEMHTPEHGH